MDKSEGMTLMWLAQETGKMDLPLTDIRKCQGHVGRSLEAQF